MSKTFFNLDILPEKNIFRRYLYDLFKINMLFCVIEKYFYFYSNLKSKTTVLFKTLRRILIYQSISCMTYNK